MFVNNMREFLKQNYIKKKINDQSQIIFDKLLIEIFRKFSEYLLIIMGLSSTRILLRDKHTLFIVNCDHQQFFSNNQVFITIIK